jgi:hypothetical protein
VPNFPACDRAGLANSQQRPAQAQQGGEFRPVFRWGPLATAHVRGRCRVLACSAGYERAVRRNRRWGQTLTNRTTTLPTSVASFDRLILLGGVHQSYVRTWNSLDGYPGHWTTNEHQCHRRLRDLFTSKRTMIVKPASSSAVISGQTRPV